MNKNTIKYIITCIIIGIIILSLLPAKTIDSSININIPNIDKIGHFFAFLLGLVMEKIQSFIPGRSMSGLDVIANTLGLFFAFVILIFSRKIIMKKFKKIINYFGFEK